MVIWLTSWSNCGTPAFSVLLGHSPLWTLVDQVKGSQVSGIFFFIILHSFNLPSFIQLYIKQSLKINWVGKAQYNKIKKPLIKPTVHEATFMSQHNFRVMMKLSSMVHTKACNCSWWEQGHFTLKKKIGMYLEGLMQNKCFISYWKCSTAKEINESRIHPVLGLVMGITVVKHWAVQFQVTHRV